MLIQNCKSYHAQTVGQRLLKMPDGKSVFKLYYLSINRRDRPEQYEWGHCRQTQPDFEKNFLAGGYCGLGFVTAFPHVTKIFRFSPYAETSLDVSEFQTDGMRPLDCTRDDGSHEFACYAETVIAAAEHAAWAVAATVEQYLSFRCAQVDFQIANHQKLAAYWG
jgi:hypothetical protein